jgi:hypothetical protein
MTKAELLQAHDDLIDAVANYTAGNGIENAVHLSASDADLRASKSHCENLTE